MAELAFDVVEQILVGLDVKDLIRCKSVCKSWQTFISSPQFVKAHLNHTYNNDRNNYELGHRRVGGPCIASVDCFFYYNTYHIVGSSNGLVCISPEDVEFLVTNPSTREEKRLQTPPYRSYMQKISMIRAVVSWGFGYDSSTDDYKVIVGFRKDNARTIFHVLSLKSNIWKVIGEVNYFCIDGRSGILCNGALHWFMNDCNKEKVILSLDLSVEEFKEIPQPDHDHLLYESNDDHRLGVIEDCLCIYSCESPSSRKWIMRNSNVKQSWELFLYDCEKKYDLAHYLTRVVDYIPHKRYLFSHNDGIRVSSTGDYIRAHIFVQSLVSPHVNNGRPRQRKKNAKEGNESVETITSGGKIRKRKKSRKHKNPAAAIY